MSSSQSPPGWSDVGDHGNEELRQRWKIAPDDPPLEFVATVGVPVAYTAFEQELPE